MTNLTRRNRFDAQTKSAIFGVLVMSATAAQAQTQSGTTIYGNLDLAMNKQSNSALSMDRGYNNWLGIMGREDLGDGLSAIFNVQMRFKPDTGEQERPSTLFQGETTVGLKSDTAGSIRLGRGNTPLWANIWLFEPWYNSGFNGSLASYQTGSYSSDGITDNLLGSANFARISNGVFYDSPTISGFRVSAAGEVATNPLGPAGQTRNVGIALNYALGPAGAMLSYERNHNNDNIYFIGGSYDFSGLVLMGSYAHTKLVGVNAAAAGMSSERLMVLAATYALGTDTIKAGFGKKVDNGDHKLSLGYSHPLSKRTTLYADLYREKIIANTTGYAVGMSHTF